MIITYNSSSTSYLMMVVPLAMKPIGAEVGESLQQLKQLYLVPPEEM
jgi:hypothetical protein